MKKFKVLSIFLLLITLLLAVVGCGETPTNNPTDGNTPTVGETPTTKPTEPNTPTELPTESEEEIDYAGTLELDMNSSTLKAEVTVKICVDGDTTHFDINVPSFDLTILKARYIACNTPESTGKVEEYGKTASNFTKSKLMSAEKIIVESDNETWNADSTGGRYVVWVWYKPAGSDTFRNLNIELLQEGLAIASNSGQNRYGTTALAAIAQAKQLKKHIYSGQNDPNFFYGDAHELTLKELRCNITDYLDEKVAFEGVIYKEQSQTVYVEEFDPETGIYFGISVYYGFNADPFVLEQLQVGNRVRVVGTLTEYQGTYQVSGVSYDIWNPTKPSNTAAISTGHSAAYPEVSPSDFNSEVEVLWETEEGIVTKTYPYAQLALGSSISMNNLQVVSVYTTTNPESSSKGAMTLTCKVGDETIVIRTEVLYDASGKLITQDLYEGKNINIKGTVEYFDGDYQIKVFLAGDITFN